MKNIASDLIYIFKEINYSYNFDRNYLSKVNNQLEKVQKVCKRIKKSAESDNIDIVEA